MCTFIICLLILILVAELSSNLYWRSPFRSFCDQTQLTEFYILHIENPTKAEKNEMVI